MSKKQQDGESLMGRKRASKIGICGSFAYGQPAVGGQTIKTRIISEELKERFGEENVRCVDTTDWKSRKLRLLIKCIMLTARCDDVILLPARNGVKILVPLFAFLSKVFFCMTHYIVVGAWLGGLLGNNRRLLRWMKRINHIYAQTNTLKEALEGRFGLRNVNIMLNFKRLSVFGEDSLKAYEGEAVRLCCLSRIEPMKGIDDAMSVIERVNAEGRGFEVYLDVFGPVKEGYGDEFFVQVNKSRHTTYKGTVNHDKAAEAIKDYYLLLFPTKYFTEGIPGTILDAYSAGVPVLSSRWESCHDVLVEDVTGVSYNFGDMDDFYEKLLNLLMDRKKVYGMKANCIKEAEKYTADKALSVLLHNLTFMEKEN